MTTTIATRSSSPNYTTTATGDDSIQVTLNDGTTKRIRVVGSVCDPHFFGKDVCEIMEITDYKDALQTMVLDDHKTTLKELLEKEINGIKRLHELGGSKPPIC